MQTIQPLHRKTWSRTRIGAVPIFLYAVVIALIAHLRLEAIWNPPYILPLLNIVFLTCNSFLISFLAARSYLKEHSPAVLFLGCGTLALGLCGALAALPLDRPSSNWTVTIYNSGACLAAACHAMSALLYMSTVPRRLRWGFPFLASLYILVFAAVLLLAKAVQVGAMPVFFVEGQGGTHWNRIALIYTTLMFGFSAIHMGLYRHGERSAFVQWYAMGLLLISVGLAGVLLQTHIGSALNWAGRMAQYTGCVYMLIAVFSSKEKNIPWRMPLENALSEMEGRYGTLVNQSPDGILVHVNGRVVFANPAAVRVYGAQSPEELIGRHVLDFVPIIDKHKIEQRIIGQRTRGITSWSDERCLRLDGKVIDIEVIAATIEYEGCPAIQAVVRDITERKRTEAALRKATEDLEARVEERTSELARANEDLRLQIAERNRAELSTKESEAKYQTLFENMVQGVFYQRADGALFDANDAALALFGLTREQLLSRNSMDAEWIVINEKKEIIPGDRHPSMVALHTGLPVRNAIIGLHNPLLKDYVWLNVNAIPQFRPGETKPYQVFGTVHDITELKRAQESLQQSLQRYQESSEATFEGIVMIENDRFVDMNEQFARMLGYEREGLLGLPVVSFVAPEYQEIVMKRIHANKETISEIAMHHKDGGVIFAEVHGKPCDYEGRAARITAFRNITERVRQDREIAILNRIYAVLSKVSQAVVRATLPGQFFEQACQIIVEDGQFLLAWIGKAEEASHRVTPAAAWGEVRDYVNGIKISMEDCPEGRGPTGVCIRERRSIIVNDFVNDPMAKPWQSRAEQFGIRASAALPIFSSGKAWGALMIYSDQVGFFSEKDVKLLEEVADSIGFALSNMEKEGMRREAEVSLWSLASAVHQAAECIIITNTDATIEYVNPAFEAVTGYTSNEAMGQNPRLLQSGTHDRAFYQELWGQISNGNPWSGRFVNRRKNGRIYHEEATISPIRDEHGQIVHYVAVKRDITRELELEEALLQAQKLESIGLLAGGVAHDLNNLLSPILGYSEILLEDTVLSEDQRDQVGEMLEAGRRARDLVRQLMAFGRKQALDTRPIDLNDLITEFSKLLRRTLREEIQFSLDLTPNLPHVQADQNQMEQVLMNLAINAQDALPAGGELSIATSVVNVVAGDNAWTGELVEGPYVLLAVRDDGIGMADDIRSRIFEPFFTTKEVGHGTGLGLSTVYGIVKQHSGAIMVESAPGKGSLFRIYLPVSSEEIDKRESSLPLANAATGSETILVAEDDPMVRAVATGMLQQFGYRVLSYESPVACLEAGKEMATSIDLLLTDVVMPEMSGNELYQELSAIIPGLRVLFMSGYTGNVIAGRGMLKQGVNFIQKPFTRHALAQKVREALDGLAATGRAE